jgi:hypothetical protein
MGKLIAPNGMGAYTAEPERVWLYDLDEEVWQVPKPQAAYIEWLLTPEWLREPRLVREFAEEVGVHIQTLYKWRKDKRFRDAMKRRADELNSDIAETQDVLNSLKAAAKLGNVKAAETWMKYRGMFPSDQKLRVQHEMVQAKDLSNPELIAEYKKQLAALEAQETTRELDAVAD